MYCYRYLINAALLILAGFMSSILALEDMCEQGKGLPIQIGAQTSNLTFVTAFDNARGGSRIIAVGYSREPQFCGNSNLSCNFVTMLEKNSMQVQVQWSKTFDALPIQNQSLVSLNLRDSSLVAVMFFSPYTIVLLDAKTGQVRASVSSNNTITNANSLTNFLQYVDVEAFGEIFVQSKNQNQSLTIVKFTENIATSSLKLAWEQQFNTVNFQGTQTGMMLREVNLNNRFFYDCIIFSGTNQINKTDSNLINIFLALNCSTGQLLWGKSFPGTSLSYFNAYLEKGKDYSAKSIMILSVDANKIQKLQIDVNGTEINSNQFTGYDLSPVADLNKNYYEDDKISVLSSQNEGLKVFTINFTSGKAYYKIVSQKNNFIASRFDYFHEILSVIQDSSILISANQFKNYQAAQGFIFSNRYSVKQSVNIKYPGQQTESLQTIDLLSSPLYLTKISAALILNGPSNSNIQYKFSQKSLRSNLNEVLKTQLGPIPIVMEPLEREAYTPPPPLTRNVIITWSYPCKVGNLQAFKSDDFNVEIQHRNGTFLKITPSKIKCFNNATHRFSCKLEMQTLRTDFNLTDRSYPLTARVKRSNSVGGWVYDSQYYVVTTVPFSSWNPPMKDESKSNLTYLAIYILSLNGSGGEETLHYDLFIKKVAVGDSQFSLYGRIKAQNQANYFYVDQSTFKMDGEYHFMYRGVNVMGPGQNSSVRVEIFSELRSQQLDPAKVSLNLLQPQTPMIDVQWSKSSIRNQQKITYYNISFGYSRYEINDSQLLTKSYRYYFYQIPLYCNGSNISVINALKCQVPLKEFSEAPQYFSDGDNILVTIQACNQLGCTNSSKVNSNVVKFGIPPSPSFTSTFYVTIGEDTSRTKIALTWSTNTDSYLQYAYPIDYRIDVQVFFNGSRNNSIWLNLTRSTNFKPNYSFSVIGLHPQITYQTVGNHTYFFKVSCFNLLGNCDYSGYEYLVYDVPDYLYVERGFNSNRKQLIVEWEPQIKRKTGYDDIISYELFARPLNSNDSMRLVLNQTFVKSVTRYSFTMPVPMLQSHYFMLRARNSFGVSQNGTQKLIYAEFSPSALKQVQVGYVEQNITISWKDSFFSYGYPFINYLLFFFDEANNEIFKFQTQYVYFQNQQQEILEKQFISIQMDIFTNFPLLFKAGRQVKVSMRAENVIGKSDATPFGSTSIFTTKTNPQWPTPTLRMTITSTGTDPQLSWPALNNQQSGLSTITNFTLYQGQYNAITKKYQYTTLLIAQAPNYNNYSFNVSGLILYQKYSFMHIASNAFGAGSNSSEIFINPGEVPQLKFCGSGINEINCPTISVIDKFVVVTWKSVFVTCCKLINFELQFQGHYSQSYNYKFDFSPDFFSQQPDIYVPMETFLSGPYHLDVDDPLYYTRLRVQNIYGWSDYLYTRGAASGDVKVKSAPQLRVGNVTFEQQQYSKPARLVWSGIKSSPGNGGVSLIDYTVYWATSNSTNWSVLAASTNYQAEIEVSDYTPMKLSAGQYKFMVQAFNQFGRGPNSTIHYTIVNPSSGMGIGAALSAALAVIYSLCS